MSGFIQDFSSSLLIQDALSVKKTISQYKIESIRTLQLERKALERIEIILNYSGFFFINDITCNQIKDKIEIIVFLAVYYYQGSMINSPTNFISKLRNDYFHPILLHISCNSFSFVNFECYNNETRNIVTSSSVSFLSM